MNRIFIALIIFSGAFAGSVEAQSRIKPGHIYSEGDSLYAPVSGVKARVPQGWIGLLPQESRVFTLMPAQSVEDNIFVFVREDNIESIKQRWNDGVEIDAGINARLDKPAEIIDGSIYGEFTQDNDPKRKIVGKAHCGEYGNCIISFALTDTKRLEGVKSALLEFTKSLSFVEPGTENLYASFDWASYLNGKYLFNYQSNQYYRKENHLWMCEDGTFTTNLKRKGVLKEEAKQYTGRKKGTYEVTGTGNFGKITLAFKGEDPIEIDTEIRDDKVFINGFQFFVTDHDTCK